MQIYLLFIFFKAIVNETLSAGNKKNDNMESIYETLYTLFSVAIANAFPDIPDPPIVIAPSGANPKFGDYQCNSAMPIANLYKQMGKKR